MSIYCKNNLCVYWETGMCSYETVSISQDGRCEDCRWMPLTEDAEARRQRVREIMDRVEAGCPEDFSLPGAPSGQGEKPRKEPE